MIALKVNVRQEMTFLGPRQPTAKYTFSPVSIAAQQILLKLKPSPPKAHFIIKPAMACSLLLKS